MGVYKYDSETQELERIAGGTLFADSPVGSIIPYGGANAPSGWLICQGQEVSRTTYSELFAVIGTAYGAGDSSTTFNVPDLREATTKGVGLSGKASTHYDNDGIALGEFVDDRIKSHAHNVYVRDTGHAHSLPLTLAADSAGGTFFSSYSVAGTNIVTNAGSANIEVSSSPNFIGESNITADTGSRTNEVKAVGVNYIIKAKQTSVPTDFSSSMVGYLGQESNYNLYPWSHVRTVEDVDTSQDITIERDGWYSIDYTLTSSADTIHSFTLRDFDSQGDVHTIMRSVYDKSGTFRQTFLVPLKAGIYRYSHGGIGTLNVYMNRRDFA